MRNKEKKKAYKALKRIYREEVEKKEFENLEYKLWVLGLIFNDLKGKKLEDWKYSIVFEKTFRNLNELASLACQFISPKALAEVLNVLPQALQEYGQSVTAQIKEHVIVLKEDRSALFFTFATEELAYEATKNQPKEKCN